MKMRSIFKRIFIVFVLFYLTASVAAAEQFNPEKNSFKFVNFQHDKISLDAYAATVGKEVANAHIGREFYNIKYSTSAKQGACFGLSAVADREKLNGEDVSAYASTDKVPDAWLNNVKFETDWRPSNVRDLILYYHGMQMFSGPLNEIGTSHSIEKIYNMAAEGSAGADPSIMLFYWLHCNCGKPEYPGHAVLPYGTGDLTNNSFALRIYDPNFPKDANIYFPFNLTSGLMFLPVKADVNKTINYGPMKYVGLVRLSTVEKTPRVIPPMEGGSNCSMIFRDTSGNSLEDKNGESISTIPGAYEAVQFKTQNDETGYSSREYVIPDGVEITREITGTGNGPAAVNIFKEHTFISLQKQIPRGSVDKLTVAEDGSDVRLISEKEASPVSLVFERELGDAQIVNIKTDMNPSETLAVSNENGEVVIEKSGEQETCEISLEHVVSGSSTVSDTFKIPVGEGNPVRINAAAWGNVAQYRYAAA